MALNVGTVEAVLSARDLFSDKFLAAADNVLKLQDSLKNVGTAAPEEIRKVQDALVRAEEEFIKIKSSAEAFRNEADQLNFTAGAVSRAILQLMDATKQAQAATQESTTADTAKVASTNAVTTAVESQTAAIKANVAAQTSAAAGFTPVAGSPLPPPNLINMQPGMSGFEAAYTEQQARAADNLAASKTKVAAATKEEEDEEVRYSQSLYQVEGIATRLVERMLILYAVRGTMQFVEGVFEAADQMLAFNERLGVSIDMLETLKYAGAQTSVPFTTLTTSVDGLFKSLEQVKPAANDALHQLGLDLEAIFQMSPDEKFNTIMTALSGVTDQATRQALEIKLGLGDAIDTVVQKWQTLQDQSNSSMTKMGDDTTRILGEQARLFKSLALEIEGYAAHLIDWGQRIVAFAATPFFYGGDPAQAARTARQTQIQVGDMMVDVAQTPGSTQRDITLGQHIGSATPPLPLNQFIGPPVPQGPAMGDMYIAQLKAQQAALQELSPHQVEQLEWLKSINNLNEQTAARVGVTTEQYRMFEAQLRSTSSAQTAAMRDAGDWDTVVAKWSQAEQAEESIGDRGLQATLARLDKQQEAEEAAAQRKLDTSKDADKWEQYNQTIEAIDEKYAARRADAEQKASEVRQRQQEQNADRLESIEQQTQDIELEIGLKGLDLKYAQLQAQEDRQKAAEDRRIAAQRQSSSYSIQDEIAYTETMIAIDEQFAAKRQQLLIAAVNNIENNAKPIEGPIKDMPLYKADIDFAVLHDGTTQWGKDLTDITKALRDLAIVSDGTFKGVVQDLSRVLASASVVNTALGQYEEGRWGMGTNVDTVMGLAGAGIGFMGATGSGNMASDIAGGAVSGGEIGMELGGPLGAGIGAGIGGVVGLIRDLFGGTNFAKDEAERMGTEFGQSWSSGLQKAVSDRAKALGDELAGEIASLPDIMKEHPVDLSNLDMYEGKIHDIFSEVQMGHITTADAAKELNQVFPQVAAVATDSYGRISDKLKEIITLNQQFGTDSKAISDWQKGQVADVVAGWSAEVSAFTSDSATATDQLRTKIEDLQAKISDLQNKKTPLTAVQTENLADYQEQLRQDQVQLSFAQVPPSPDELQAVGSGAVGSVAMQMATGTSRSDAIKAESQALTQLESEYKKLGIDVQDVGLKSLFMQNDVQKAAPQLIAGVEGLRKEIVGLDNLNLETGDSFKKNEALGMAMYTKIQGAVAALGGDTADALTQMQDYLHVAQDEAKKLGVPLDANLQLMIDQSKELGIWDDKAGKAKSSTDKLADAIQRLVDWLDKIPATRNVDVNVNQHTNTDNTDTGGPPPPPPDNGMAQGGIPARIAAAGALAVPLTLEMGGELPPGAMGLSGGGEAPGLPEYAAGGEHMVRGYCVPAHMSRNPAHHSEGGSAKYYEAGGETEPIYADQGAYISWIPRGSDVVPAMLTPGEGIISVPGMDSIGGESSLNMINAGEAKVVSKTMVDAGQPVTVTVDPPVLQPSFDITLDPSKALSGFDMKPQGLALTPADTAPINSLSVFATNAPKLTDPVMRLGEFANESPKLIDPVRFLAQFAGNSAQMNEPVRHLDSFAGAASQMTVPVGGLATFAVNSPILTPPVQALQGFTALSPQMTEPVNNLRIFAGQSPTMTAPVGKLVDFAQGAPAITVPATAMTGFAGVAPSITVPAQQMSAFAGVAGDITIPAATLTGFATKADLTTQPVKGMIAFSDAAPQTTEPVSKWIEFAIVAPQMVVPLNTLIAFADKVIDLASHLPNVGSPAPTPPPFVGGVNGPVPAPAPGPFHGGVNTLTPPPVVMAPNSTLANSSSSISSDSHDAYTFHMNITTQATDAQQLASEAQAPGGLIDTMIQNITFNKYGRGTILKRGLSAA